MYWSVFCPSAPFLIHSLSREAFFMVVGFCGIFVQGVILKVLNDFIGERRLLIFCFLVGAIHDTMYATARTKFVIFLSGALASLVIMAFPTISAIKSNNVDKTEQGRIQGALYSVQALASAAGPTIFRFVADACRHTYFGTGAMFLVATVMYLAATVCAYLLPVRLDGEINKGSQRITLMVVLFLLISLKLIQGGRQKTMVPTQKRQQTRSKQDRR